MSALDEKVTMGTISGSTAANIWGTTSKLFDDATNAKASTGLRLLSTNPAEGVRGPEAGAQKLLQFLYPSEFLAFVECEAVPLTWRRNVAIATYLCLRDGEQRALKWDAVDLAHGVVAIVETFDRRTGEERSGTKSGAARHVPIPDALMPVLRAMRELDDGEGYVCHLPSLRDMARGLRRWLRRAGVDRPQLHESTPVSRALRWHDLRATGLTWYAVKGEAPTTIRDIAGHTETSMTDRYVRAAGLLRGGRFGSVFPTLPAALGIPETNWADVAQWSEEDPFSAGNWRGGRDSKAVARGASKSQNVRKNTDGDAVHGESSSPTSDASEPPLRSTDPIESALAEAVRVATKAGAWDVVIRLADELQARRIAASSVTKGFV